MMRFLFWVLMFFSIIQMSNAEWKLGLCSLIAALMCPLAIEIHDSMFNKKEPR